MKIVLTTIFVALLAIGLVGINNNNTNNIDNAFAQEGTITPEGMNNNTMSTGSDTGMKLNGTVNVESTIAEAFKSKITTDIIGAIEAAQASVGANSFVKEAELTDAHGYLVYKIKVVDENLKKYKVIVDPGNGQVLIKKEITWYEDEHEKMKYGDEERYDKYSGSQDYKDDKYGNHGSDDYDKEKMMMKEKEY